MITYRNKPRRKTTGLYVDVKLEGVDMSFTVDTGATRTIISQEIFNRIPSEKRTQLVSKEVLRPMVGANGSRINTYGRYEVEIEIGSLKLQKDVVVAEIQDEGLMGMDILDNGSGDNRIHLNPPAIEIDGVKCPCRKYGPQGIRRVRAADHFLIPAYTEQILPVYVDRLESDDERVEVNVVIEPTPSFTERYSLDVGRTLVNLNIGPTVFMRLVNATRQDVSVHQDTVMGVAEDVENSDIIMVDTKESSSDNVSRSEEEHCTKLKVVDDSTIPEHLKELYEQTIKGKSDHEKTKIAKLLILAQDTFSKHDDDLGLTSVTKHIIDTGNERPIKQAPRRVPLAFAGEEITAIEKMKTQGIIRESNSPWSSPIVLVRKKCGGVRICGDFRKVNSVTRKDAFPIPRIQDCLDALGSSMYFSTLDMTSSYNQVPIREEDIPKTAFVTKHGLFEYKTMPFGLCNAPSTFQRMMELILRGLQWKTCLVYLDDVIVFSTSFQEHLERLTIILEKIREANLKLKPVKCSLFQKEVEFLGHVVSEQGIQPNERNIQKIVNWPEPKNVTETRQFLGLCSYYRRFIRKVGDPFLSNNAHSQNGSIC